MKGERPMKMLVCALLAVAFLAASAAADASGRKRHYGERDSADRRAAKRVERYRAPQEFDETKYYERLSEKIPFGTPAWWRQKQDENPVP
jgi:hypothetical protein